MAHIEGVGAWPPMRRLTSLRLQRSRPDPMPDPTVLLNAQYDAPDLIYLSIHDYFPRDWPTDHDVRPDSRVTLLAAQEVIAEDGFDELLEGVRNRIDEIESLHRTREVTFKDLGDGDKIRLSVDKSGGETLRTLWGPPS